MFLARNSTWTRAHRFSTAPAGTIALHTHGLSLLHSDRTPRGRLEFPRSPSIGCGFQRCMWRAGSDAGAAVGRGIAGPLQLGSRRLFEASERTIGGFCSLRGEKFRGYQDQRSIYFRERVPAGRRRHARVRRPRATLAYTHCGREAAAPGGVFHAGVAFPPACLATRLFANPVIPPH